MNTIITRGLQPDPHAVTPVNKVVANAKKTVPNVRRADVIAALANSGHQFTVLNGTLHLVGFSLGGTAGDTPVPADS